MYQHPTDKMRPKGAHMLGLLDFGTRAQLQSMQAYLPLRLGLPEQVLRGQASLLGAELGLLLLL